MILKSPQTVMIPAVRVQEDAGLDGIADGGLRRTFCLGGLLEQLGGVAINRPVMAEPAMRLLQHGSRLKLHPGSAVPQARTGGEGGRTGPGYGGVLTYSLLPTPQPETHSPTSLKLMVAPLSGT